MLNKTGAMGLLVVLGLIVFAARYSREPVSAQEKPNAAVQKWEYKIVIPESFDDPRLNQKQFNQLGTDGWELCAAHSSTRPNYCIFKRPKR